MGDIWAFLKDPANQQVLAWLGGGVVVAAGGLWAVVKFRGGSKGGDSPGPSVTAKNGSKAVGRDNINSQTKINFRDSGKQ